jgi:hypothetical protein
LIYTLIREVQLYQDQPFCFQPVEEIILGFKAAFNVFLESTSDELKALDDRLFEVSLAQEPRGADRSQII